MELNHVDRVVGKLKGNYKQVTDNKTTLMTPEGHDDSGETGQYN